MKNNYFLNSGISKLGKKYVKTIALLLVFTLFNNNAFGQSGASLHFDGSNDKVNLGNSMNAALATLNTITVEAWVKPGNATFNGVIVGNYHNPFNSEMQFLLRRDFNTYTFWVDDNDSFKVVSTANVVDLNVWQHIVGVWNGSDLKIYVNGVLAGTTTGVEGANFASSDNDIVIGGNTYPEMFAGAIDEVRIWYRALPQAEILNNMNCELASGQTGLLAYYKFNQGDDNADNTAINTLADSSGNNHDGTLTSFNLTGSASNWVGAGAVTSGNQCPLFLGTADFDMDSGLSVYPNPFIDFITIELGGNAEVVLYNMIGKIILSQTMDSGLSQIDVSNYPDGIYFLKMTGDHNKTKTVKLIKQ